jgi:hypothetical protein
LSYTPFLPQHVIKTNKNFTENILREHPEITKQNSLKFFEKSPPLKNHTKIKIRIPQFFVLHIGKKRIELIFKEIIKMKMMSFIILDLFKGSVF